jgi:hypothetical protein
MARERVSLLDRTLPPSFVTRVITVPAGARRPQEDPAEWLDALLVVERGELEIELEDRTGCRLGRGAVLSLSGLPVRALKNPGPDATVLVGVWRRMVPTRWR